MAEKTLIEVFGDGASQTETEIIINKPALAAILAAVGHTFTPSATNSVDELMAAIVCAGLINLKPIDRDTDPVNRNIEFRYDPTLNYDRPTLNGQTFDRHTVEVAMYKAISAPNIHPSDY